MTFVSHRTARGIAQGAVPDENEPVSSFGDTFGASLGLVIDEELSVSSTLNREGWAERRSLIEQRIDEGVLNREQFRHPRKGFDYNAAAESLNDPLIKTDDVLREERNEMLAKRREYAQGVIERGPATANFLGAANGYILDPINLMTVPIAFPTTTAKSLNVLGRALLTARNVAVVEGVTELAIQPFVYDHKMDIESPYSFRDAVTNIAFAAGGGGALGFAGGGISGYLRKVLDTADSAKIAGPDEDAAKQYIERMIRTVEQTPQVKDLDDAFKAGKITQDEYNQQKLEAEKNFLLDLEDQRARSNQPSRKPAHYAGDEPTLDIQKAAIPDRQRAVLQAQGLDAEYDMAMKMVDDIDNPVAYINDEVVDYRMHVKAMDEEIEGVESVLRCVRGK